MLSLHNYMEALLSKEQDRHLKEKYVKKRSSFENRILLKDED